MRAVVQRVSEASVTVNNEICGEIGNGILVYAGFESGDSEKDIDWMLKKIPYLRIFTDENYKMNFSVTDLGYDIMVISQFTLLGDCRKGRRPSYDKAEKPDKARQMYEIFLSGLRETGLNIASGRFQAHMDVRYNNDGPITMILDSRD